MFNFLTPKIDSIKTNGIKINNISPNIKPAKNHSAISALKNRPLNTNAQRVRHRPSSVLITSLISSALLISACNPQSATDTDGVKGPDITQNQIFDKQISNQIVPQSDSAAARVAQFQPLYVTQMQGLQRRLQAEYESLEAADAANSDTVSLNPPNDSATIETDPEKRIPPSLTTDSNDTLNTSTEVGERDLEVLKSLSLEIQKPTLLTEDDIVERYQQAMQALYQPNDKLLDAQQSDTLLNIATLTPQLFEHPEIAERLTIKSPALGRLIIQYQVWQQIEVQHAIDMQQMKETQQQEFDGLMTKFDDTIKDYDEQIAKYEETLKTLTKK